MTEKFSMDKAGDSSEDLSASGSELSDDADSFASEDEVDEDISEGSDGGQIPSSSHAGTSARKRPAPEIGLVSKKQKLNKSELYKPPTNEELNQLKETETLFRSSLFRMQVTELLKEVTLTEKRRKQMDQFVKVVMETVETMPAGTKKTQISDLSWLRKTGICFPLSRPPSEVKGYFLAAAAKSVKVIGSYSSKTCTKPNPHVDILLELPKEFVDTKDYLNQRYFHKRALYLCYVAEHLRTTGIAGEMSFLWHQGNPMKPILELTSPDRPKKFFSVRIHVGLERGTLKFSRFQPSKNNVRTQWYDAGKSLDKDVEPKQPATPHYNSLLLQDLLLSSHAEEIQQALGDSAGLQEGIALLKIWLHQRCLAQSAGSMSPFILSMLVVYLLRKGILQPSMSSYQVFRNTLIFLAQSDWTQKGLTLAGSKPGCDGPSLAEFHQHFEVVFVDPSGHLNLCADMNKAVFLRVQHEAELSVKHLEIPGMDCFQALLMTPGKFMHKFDQVIHLSGLDQWAGCVAKLNLSAGLADYSGDVLACCLPSLLQLLHKALGPRVTLIGLQLPPIAQWPVTQCVPVTTGSSSVSLGLLLNPEHASSAVDRGPPADSPQAQAFQLFWGEKSELRRFQDGSICEAVVWPAKNIADRRQIVGKIVKLILNRHAGISRDSITIINSQLESVLRMPKRKKGKVIPYGTGEEHFTNVICALDELGKALRSLTELPLAIHSIQGTDAVSRYAEVFPPLPTFEQKTAEVEKYRRFPTIGPPCCSYVPSVKIQCLLEASGKWPEDKDAVERLRAAFHVKLGQLLRKHYKLTATIRQNHVEVFKAGYVFRVQIGYLKEISLLKMVKTADGKVKMLDTVESIDMEKQLIFLPRLASTLHGLQQQYGSYCSAVRLCKRWIGGQMLSRHIAEEAVELLTAHIYLHPAPLTAPGSPQTAFLRFLRLLGSHDWMSQPLMVDLNKEFTKEDYTDIPAKFHKERSSLPLLFISTPQDKFSSVTKQQPSAPILQRLILLAQESLRLVEVQLEDTGIHLDFKQIFRPPLDVFDVLLYLHVAQLPRHYQAIDVKEGLHMPPHTPEEKGLLPRPLLPVSNFDPVEYYLNDLKDAFGEMALFFHDPYGGDVIGILWKPNMLRAAPFKLSCASWRRPATYEGAKGEVELVPNMAAILEDIKVMGTGLLKEIHTKTAGMCESSGVLQGH